MLVAAGADIEIADCNGKTAIDIAKASNHTALDSYLATMSKRRRRLPFAQVRTSIRNIEESRLAIMKVLQNDDLAREIMSYL
jgi:ankyrin repeat protein